MEVPTLQQLADAITEATRLAVTHLFAEHDERFYYLSLITTGEAHSPELAAWSEEALEREAAGEDDREEALADLKWSYADSPYFCYGEEFYEQVKQLFSRRPRMSVEMSAEEWDTEHDFRMRAMELALSKLDDEGLFGTGAARHGIVVNAEVMPPDHGNTQRAIRLNPPDALEDWLAEHAE